MDSVHTIKTRPEEEGEGDTPSESTTIEYEAQGVIDEGGGKLCEMAPKPKLTVKPKKNGWHTGKTRIIGDFPNLYAFRTW